MRMTHIQKYVFLLDFRCKNHEQREFTSAMFCKFIREFSNELDHLQSNADILIPLFFQHEGGPLDIDYTEYDRKYMVGDWINESASEVDDLLTVCIDRFTEYYDEKMTNVEPDKIAIITLVDRLIDMPLRHSDSPLWRSGFFNVTHNVTVPFSHHTNNERDGVWESFYDADYFIQYLDGKESKGRRIQGLKKNPCEFVKICQVDGIRYK